MLPGFLPPADPDFLTVAVGSFFDLLLLQKDRPLLGCFKHELRCRYDAHTFTNCAHEFFSIELVFELAALLD